MATCFFALFSGNYKNNYRPLQQKKADTACFLNIQREN